MQTPALFLVSAIFSFANLLPSAHAAETLFPDVRDPELREAVEFFHEQGVLKGYEDGLFHPERTINRAETLKIVYASQEATLHGTKGDKKSPFDDVQLSDWYFPYVYTANYHKIIKGYDDRTYRPNQEVNRAEFVKIAVRSLDDYVVTDPYRQLEAAQDIPDVDRLDWVMPYLAFLSELKATEFPEGFRPEEDMTRGDAVLLLKAIHDAKAERQATWKEEHHQRGCEMCVDGEDLSQYAWAHLPYVTVENGEISIQRYEGKTDGESVSNLEFMANRALINNYALDIPTEQIARFDQDFPELYNRVIGLSGGFMRDLEFRSGRDKTPIRMADGRKLMDHIEEGNYERFVIKAFSYGKQYNPHELDFHDWKYTLEGKRGMMAGYFEQIFFDGDVY